MQVTDACMKLTCDRILLTTHQLAQTERGLSGSGPWSMRLLYSDI